MLTVCTCLPVIAAQGAVLCRLIHRGRGLTKLTVFNKDVQYLLLVLRQKKDLFVLDTVSNWKVECNASPISWCGLLHHQLVGMSCKITWGTLNVISIASVLPLTVQLPTVTEKMELTTSLPSVSPSTTPPKSAFLSALMTEEMTTDELHLMSLNTWEDRRARTLSSNMIAYPFSVRASLMAAAETAKLSTDLFQEPPEPTSSSAPRAITSKVFTNLR